jgi:hypothetical protein
MVDMSCNFRSHSCSLQLPLVKLVPCLHIDSSSDEDVIVVFDLCNCSLSLCVFKKTKKHFTIDSLNPLFVCLDHFCVLIEDLLKGIEFLYHAKHRQDRIVSPLVEIH